MGYYIDFKEISVDNYKEKIESGYLPPSRMILKEGMDERFDYFKSIGIKNIEELIQLLKKKEKFTELSGVDCLSGDYLKILLRELNSTLQKPNRINEFSGITSDTVSRLEKIGITNTFFYRSY